jgi:hypothetical protein
MHALCRYVACLYVFPFFLSLLHHPNLAASHPSLWVPFCVIHGHSCHSFLPAMPPLSLPRRRPLALFPSPFLPLMILMFLPSFFLSSATNLSYFFFCYWSAPLPFLFLLPRLHASASSPLLFLILCHWSAPACLISFSHPFFCILCYVSSPGLGVLELLCIGS